jgi:hydroxymethylpyrimidine pyrophosphatase-like HAD family hydrolase
MRYLAFATDYDGTLAWGGRVTRETIKALEDLKASGRKLLLVTGRHLGDLQRVFSEIDLFDRVVAENGALLFDPATQEQRTLAEAPSADFLQGLRDAGVRFDLGRVIISSWTPQQTTILEVIRRFALDYQIIFNKDAVMVLPSGVNKATGLRAALRDLHLSVHKTIAVGDAENDHSFLSAAGCGVAVANALPSLKERADIVTIGDHGQGVIEVIHRLLKEDLRSFNGSERRSGIEAERPH